MCESEISNSFFDINGELASTSIMIPATFAGETATCDSTTHNPQPPDARSREDHVDFRNEDHLLSDTERRFPYFQTASLNNDSNGDLASDAVPPDDFYKCDNPFPGAQTQSSCYAKVQEGEDCSPLWPPPSWNPREMDLFHAPKNTALHLQETERMKSKMLEQDANVELLF